MSTTAAIVRFSLTEASAQLGVTTTFLKKQLKARSIEPSGAGYSLKQLVAAMMPLAGDSREASLRAHQRLQESKARLVEHQLSERENQFIDREEALSFLGRFMRTIYDFLFFRSGLDQQIREELERELELLANSVWLEKGWQLEPVLTASANGESVPPTRYQKWASQLCALAYETKEAQSQDEDTEPRDVPQRRGRRVQSARSRNRRARAVHARE